MERRCGDVFVCTFSNFYFPDLPLEQLGGEKRDRQQQVEEQEGEHFTVIFVMSAMKASPFLLSLLNNVRERGRYKVRDENERIFLVNWSYYGRKDSHSVSEESIFLSVFLLALEYSLRKSPCGEMTPTEQLTHFPSLISLRSSEQLTVQQWYCIGMNIWVSSKNHVVMCVLSFSL